MSTGGCIYCQGGSGARLASSLLPLCEQYKKGIEVLGKKWQTDSYIPYLQAYTNTHTSPAILEKTLEDVSKFEGAVMLDIATRADCLENEKIERMNLIFSFSSLPCPPLAIMGVARGWGKSVVVLAPCLLPFNVTLF